MSTTAPNEDFIFHLALPCHDLDKAEAFYVKSLGCRLARKYSDRITLDFFGHQVVCHLSTAIDEKPKMYPRHYGITFKRSEDFNRILESAQKSGVKFFQKPFTRFSGKREEHTSFFIVDPSNNLIEFKHYNHSEMMY